MPSYGSTMIIFVVFGAIFLTLGISLYVMSDKVQQASIDYGTDCDASTQDNYCVLTMTLDATIPGPVYVYYELGNFYQNHRRYVQSVSYPQLMGKQIDSTQAVQCEPIVTNADVGRNFSVDGTPLNQNATAYPCGLIAKSVFTDNYTLSTVDFSDALYDPLTDNVQFDETNIAWKSDREKFKNQDGDWNKTQWIDVTNCKIHLFSYKFLFRAFHCLDENGWPTHLQKTLRLN